MGRVDAEGVRIPTMLRGAIVGESLRVGAALDGVPLKVQKLERVDAGLAEQPAEWTLLWFEADDADADQLAEQLSSALEARGGWYADLHSDSEVIVVFAGRIFRYRRGDTSERSKVADYARSVGVPDDQLDWGRIGGPGARRQVGAATSTRRSGAGVCRPERLGTAKPESRKTDQDRRSLVSGHRCTVAEGTDDRCDWPCPPRSRYESDADEDHDVQAARRTM
jgi:hypothetical protein